MKSKKEIKPTMKWQVNEYASAQDYHFTLPYQFPLLCKLIEVPPRVLLLDFMDNLSCGSWKRKGGDQAKTKLIEYFLEHGMVRIITPRKTSEKYSGKWMPWVYFFRRMIWRPLKPIPTSGNSIRIGGSRNGGGGVGEVKNSYIFSRYSDQLYQKRYQSSISDNFAPDTIYETLPPKIN